MAATTLASNQRATKGSSRRKAVVAGAVIAVLICALVGGAIHQQRFAPFQTTVLIVNDSSVCMEYRLTRILMPRAGLTERLAYLRLNPYKPPFDIRMSVARWRTRSTRKGS